MRILIIAPEQIPVPPAVGGSVEHSIYQIAKKIPSNHTVTIVSKWHKNYPKSSTRGNLTIIRVTGSTKSAYLQNVLRKIKGQHYDIIQIDNRPRFIPVVRKQFPYTKIAIFLHSKTFISAPITSKKQASSDLEGANLIVGNSRSLIKHLEQTFPHLTSKLRSVHLGVDLHQFRPRSIRRKDGRSFVVLFAGRLIPLKGIPVLSRPYAQVLQCWRLFRLSVSRT